MTRRIRLFVLVFITMMFAVGPAWAAEPWIVYEGGDGPGKGRHIVLISGDEEYRSEEALPMLGRILAARHGFTCTVLFAIDPQTGRINPDRNDHIPGLEALKTADLMILFTRFRNLPDEQMQHIADYLARGKPLMGIRTATHAFNIPPGRKFHSWSFNYKGDDFVEGFGRQILGETWIAHHGAHGRESTRGIIAPSMSDHPIVHGIRDGAIWGPSDVYTIRLPMPEGARPIVLGQVLTGMKPTDPPVEGAKNDPMMPLAWLKPYTYEGRTGTAFCSTLGAATDLVAEGSRRMFVNAVYYLLGMAEQIPSEGTDVRTVGEYDPTDFSFGGYRKGVTPADHEL